MILCHYKVEGAHPIYKVLWNWMVHPKRISQLNVTTLLNVLKTNFTKCLYFSPLTPTYVMFTHRHLPLHIHSWRHFPQLQYVPNCL